MKKYFIEKTTYFSQIIGKLTMNLEIAYLEFSKNYKKTDILLLCNY